MCSPRLNSGCENTASCTPVQVLPPLRAHPVPAEVSSSRKKAPNLSIRHCILSVGRAWGPLRSPARLGNRPLLLGQVQ